MHHSVAALVWPRYEGADTIVPLNQPGPTKLEGGDEVEVKDAGADGGANAGMWWYKAEPSKRTVPVMQVPAPHAALLAATLTPFTVSVFAAAVRAYCTPDLDPLILTVTCCELPVSPSAPATSIAPAAEVLTEA